MTLETLRFTSDQRTTLWKCGLNETQVDALEIELGPCQAYTRDAPALHDVRAELQATRKFLNKALDGLLRLRDAPETSSALLEAQARIYQSLYTLGGTGTGTDIAQLRRAITYLRSLGTATTHAERELGNAQRRTKRASMLPIKFIHEALYREFYRSRETLNNPRGC